MTVKTRRERHRSQDKILMQLLEHIQEKRARNKTRLMYTIGTTHTGLDGYLETLSSRGLISLNKETNRPEITHRGEEFLRLMKKINNILGEAIMGEED